MSRIDIIYEFCSEYKRATENLISAAKEEDFDKIDELLALRQQLMEKLSNEDYEKSLLNQALKDNGIWELEKCLRELLEGLKSRYANSIMNIEKNKRANQVYNLTPMNNNLSILSKKV